MRASLLAVVAIAIIAGLGVVFAVKSLGLLDQPRPIEQVVVVKEVPPPPPPVPPAPRILAPTRNLFAGDPMTGYSLGIRSLRPEEVKDYEANKDDYLPGSLEAAMFRTAARDLPGDRGR